MGVHKQTQSVTECGSTSEPCNDVRLQCAASAEIASRRTARLRKDGVPMMVNQTNGCLPLRSQEPDLGKAEFHFQAGLRQQADVAPETKGWLQKSHRYGSYQLL